MKISLIQNRIIAGETSANLGHLRDIFPENADLVVLPELFHCGSLKDMNFLTEEDGNKALQWLQMMSMNYHTTICGSVAKMTSKMLYNRFYVVNYDSQIEFYDKKHLFSMGNEKKYFKGGVNPLIFEVSDFKVKPLICYDLRFPVWCRQPQKNMYDLLICVANWPSSRMDVFHTLLKARALENQAFTVGVNCVGEVDGIRYSGGSIIFSPRGEIIAQSLENTEEIITAELDLESLNQFRRKFPVLEDRDGYKIYPTN